MTLDHHKRALAFHALHDHILVAPNAWDPVSARSIEAAGAQAIATTSAGIAATRGVVDGGGLDADVALDALERIIGSVALPVSADLERGYADATDGVVETVERAIALGIAGLNLEDSKATVLEPVDVQVSLLRAVTDAITNSGIPVFLNARIDTLLFRDSARSDDELLAETIERGRAYVASGANGVFVPGLTDRAATRTLCDAIDAPVNIMLGADPLTVGELLALGVRRVTWGPEFMTRSEQHLREEVRGVLEDRDGVAHENSRREP